MKKIFQKYNKLEEYILIGSLAFNVLLIFSQIIMRSIFNYSLSWTEELSRYIFIWQIWLGTSISFRYKQHIRVEILTNILKGKSKKKLEIFVSVVWLIFNGILVYIGLLLSKSMVDRNILSSGMRIPLIYIYMCLPISSFVLFLRILIDTYEMIKKE